MLLERNLLRKINLNEINLFLIKSLLKYILYIPNPFILINSFIIVLFYSFGLSRIISFIIIIFKGRISLFLKAINTN